MERMLVSVIRGTDEMNESGATRLAVVILTKDEERNIAACVESVGWADEVVVFDHALSPQKVGSLYAGEDVSDAVSSNWLSGVQDDIQASEARAINGWGSGILASLT